MDLPFVSIVMPVYNGGQYFALALESALNQNYPNFEIIVVDDGSSDGGEARRISASGGDKVTYIYQENRGVAGALNTGVAAMRGDIFCWLSHDDLFLPDKTMLQALYFAKLGEKNAILFSDYNLIGPKGEYMQTIRADHGRLISVPMAALMSGSINGCTIFAPAHAMRSGGLFDEKLRYTQDYDFWSRLLVNFEFFHQKEITVNYRVHPDQGSNNPQAIVEGDALWTNIMRQRSEVERVQMHGSSRRFFARMHSHLINSPYLRAAQYALYRSNAAESVSKVSVVVCFFGEDSPDALQKTLASLRSQTRMPDEIIIVSNNLNAGSPDGSRVVCGHGTKSDLIESGLRQTSGDYLMALQAGETLAPHSLLSRVQAMHDLGGVTGYVGAGDPEEAVLAGKPLVFSQIVFHRCILGYGSLFPADANDFGTGWSLAALLRRHPPTRLASEA